MARRTLVVAALVAALPFLAFWRVLAPGPARRYFPPGDFTDQFFAFAAFETRSLAEGRLPVWNPFAYSGTPFWADVQAAVAYPPSLLHTLFWSTAHGRMPFVALELEAVAHLSLAAILTLAAAYRLTGSLSAGVVAGITFGLGGYLTGYPALQLAILESAAWLPLGVLALHIVAVDFARSDRPPALPRRAIAGLAAAVSLAMLAGHPQTALHVAYCLALFGGVALWPVRRRLGVWTGLALAAVLALAGSAAGWLPALEYYALSDRPQLAYAELAHGFPPGELLGLVLPERTQFSPLYVGVLPLAFALAAVYRRLVAPPGERPPGYPGTWAFVAGLGLAVALGGNGFLFPVLYNLAPGFDLFRGQERAALWVAFSLAMLAASGFADWERRPKEIAGGVAAAAVAIAAIALAGLMAGPDTGRSAALRVLVLAAATSGWAAATVNRAGWSQSRALTAIAIALVAADLWAVGAGAHLVFDRPAELAESPTIELLKEDREGRVQNDYRLPGNFGVLHGVESTSGASPLWLAHTRRLEEALADREDRLWQLAGVSHVLTWRHELPAPATLLLETDLGGEAARLFRLNQPGPRLWRVSRADLAADEASALAALRADTFDPLLTVILQSGEAGAHPLSRGALVEGDRAAGRLVADVDGDAPGWLVAAEPYHPGWRATVSGQPVPVLRANVAFIAVPFPPGHHTIDLRFEAPWVGLGLAASAIAWLVGLGLLLTVRPYGGSPQGRRRAMSS